MTGTCGPLDEFLLVCSTPHGDLSLDNQACEASNCRGPRKLKFGSLDKLLPHSGLEED